MLRDCLEDTIAFQLGHVFSDMEMRRLGVTHLKNNADVSIGPRLFRHGNATDSTYGNGSEITGVSIGPRLFRHGNRSGALIQGKQEYESFNWATSFQTWKWISCNNPNKRYIKGFNWATSFQTWKFCRSVAEYIVKHSVSIGPRLFRHGNTW